MNRLYIIKVGSKEIRGLISPGELPNLRSDFEWLAGYYKASVEFSGGMLTARKNDVVVSLTVGAVHGAIPGRQIHEALVQVMKEHF